MISIDDRDFKKLEKDLKTFGARALPFATKATLNGAAFSARKIAQDTIGAKMTERNAFTRRSIQVQKAFTLNIAHQEAIVGSTADYMETQEFGGSKKKTGKHGVAIPTSEASGEGPSAFPRRRVVRRANKLSVLTLTKRRASGDRKQRNKIAIMEAISTKRRFVFLDLGRRSGIFRVLGSKKNPRLRKLWDMSKPHVVIPKRPWLAPSVAKAQAAMPRQYEKALRFQLKRLGIFEK